MERYTKPQFFLSCILLFCIFLLGFSVAAIAEERAPQQNENSPFLSKGEMRHKGLFQGINLNFSWTPDSGNHGMELSEVKLGVAFGLPAPNIKPLVRSFFMISPNFTYTNIRWKGSDHFPDSLYGASLAVTWLKPINERWSIMLNVAPGYAGDGKASRDTTRCPVMFGATWTPNKKWKVLFGAIYTDRSDIPFLPLAGATYTPNEDWRFELTAPQPKIARRLSGWCNTNSERWMYVGGGFGGGTWAIESVGNKNDLAMLREYSLIFGYESTSKTSVLKWNAEIAWLFGRKMKFDHHTQPDRTLDDSLSLRLRCSF